MGSTQLVFVKPSAEHSKQHWPMPASICWSCGQEFSHHCGPCDPKPGELSLCLSCTAISIFTERGHLREPTPVELAHYSLNDEVRNLQSAIQAVNRRARLGEHDHG